MDKRTSYVKQLSTNIVSSSSILSIGDTKKTDQKVKVIAVQTNEENLNDIDVDFEDYPIFSRQVNWPKMKKTSITKKTFHHQPTIDVQSVDIIGISNASVFQIGSIENIKGEARLKHIRIITD